jgi:uncharacterized protein (DUF2267 family)
VSATGVKAFDSTLHTTHVWLNEVCEEMGWARDPERAYHALRSVLHALRDRLHPDEAAGLAAQLPLLLRGSFYEGWHPAGKPVRSRSAGELLAPVASTFQGESVALPAGVARGMSCVLKRHVSAGRWRTSSRPCRGTF